MVIEHVLAQRRREKAGEDGAQGASQLGELASTPQHGEPALDAADEARDDAGRTAEEQARGQRGGVADVHGGAIDFDARLGAVDGYEAEHDAHDDLPALFGDVCHVRVLS